MMQQTSKILSRIGGGTSLSQVGGSGGQMDIFVEKEKMGVGGGSFKC